MMGKESLFLPEEASKRPHLKAAAGDGGDDSMGAIEGQMSNFGMAFTIFTVSRLTVMMRRRRS